MVDEGETVGLQVFGSADEQAARHRLGVRRLLLLTLPERRDVVKVLIDQLSNTDKPSLAGSPYPTVAELPEDCLLAVLGDAVHNPPPVRDEAAFVALAAAVGPDLAAGARGVPPHVFSVLQAWRSTQTA